MAASAVVVWGLLSGVAPRRGKDYRAAPSVAGTVDEVPIFSRSVNDLVTARGKDIGAKDSVADVAKQLAGLRKEAVRGLRNRELIDQEIARRALTISEEAIDARIADIVQETFHGDYPALWAELSRQGYTEERFRAVERNKIAWEAWLQELRAKADIRIYQHLEL